MVEQFAFWGLPAVVFQIGRFHPVVLHLPIGFLLLAFAMELGLRFFGKKEFSSAIGFSLKIALVASAISVITGYNLAQEGGYDLTLVTRHQYLGFGVLGLNVLLVYLFPKAHQEKNPNPYYFPIFILLVIIIGLTGHLGGSLTHGTQFLTGPAPEKKEKFEGIDSAKEYYSEVVHPIFVDRCIACHNSQKEKGGLRLDSREAILKGGDSGKLLTKLTEKDPLLLHRLKLPLTDEEHMPPKGKVQLTESEKALLQFWIEEGASFDKNINSFTFDQSTQNHLKIWETHRLKINQQPDLDPVNPTVISRLKEKGIDISPLAANSPYLEAKIIYQDSLSISPLKELKKVKHHLVNLKLHNTSLKDQGLKNISSFSRLKKLDLHQTNITDKSLYYIAELENLEYLNLYQTQITDEGLSALKKLTRLKEIFLWQTKVTAEASKKLEQEIPGLQVNLGRSELVFGKSQIKTPKVWSTSLLFKDTLHLKFINPIPGGILRYTLDGSPPDSLSQIYHPPLILEQHTHLRLVCEKEGWKTSEIFEREYIKPDIFIENIQLLNEPSPKYRGNGDSSLYDLQSAFAYTASEGWLGFQGQHVEMIIDLGEVQEVKALRVGSFTNVLAWVFPIRGIICSTSMDGKNYGKKETINIPEAKAGTPIVIDYFKLPLAPRKARYLKVKLLSQMKNPAWHASPGKPSWIFIDEVLVW